MQLLKAKIVLRLRYVGTFLKFVVEGAMKEGNVGKWSRLFKDGRNRVHKEERSVARTVQVANLLASPIQSQPCTK
jgi:hypothetical protein